MTKRPHGCGLMLHFRAGRPFQTSPATNQTYMIKRCPGNTSHDRWKLIESRRVSWRSSYSCSEPENGVSGSLVPWSGIYVQQDLLAAFLTFLIGCLLRLTLISVKVVCGCMHSRKVTDLCGFPVRSLVPTTLYSCPCRRIKCPSCLYFRWWPSGLFLLAEPPRKVTRIGRGIDRPRQWAMWGENKWEIWKRGTKSRQISFEEKNVHLVKRK